MKIISSAPMELKCNVISDISNIVTEQMEIPSEVIFIIMGNDDTEVMFSSMDMLLAFFNTTINIVESVNYDIKIEFDGNFNVHISKTINVIDGHEIGDKVDANEFSGGHDCSDNHSLWSERT